MKYDFTSIMDRHGKDATAIDGLGSMPGFTPDLPKEGYDAIPMWVADCWVSVKQFSKNDTATACQDWLRSTRLGRGSIKSHVRTVKVLGMGLFAFQERIHLWKGVTH